MSVNDWYTTFLANRPVEMKRNVARGKKTSCFQVYIGKLKCKHVTAGIGYMISAFLYDTKTSQMFGRQCRGEWRIAEVDEEIVFNESLFFYSVINDKDILLIMEFVEQGQGQITPTTSIGWLMTSVEKKQMAEVTETINVDIYGGTPKLLVFDKDMVRKPVGKVEFVYQNHEMPPVFVQCLPEFSLVCEADFIPGIEKNLDDEWWLSTPKEMITIPAAIDSIVIQFKNNVPELEKQITQDIEREWALKQGNGFRPKAVIMDRKLKIGVHNTFTYVTEPFTTDLEIVDTTAGGTLRSRKKPIDFGKLQQNIVFQAAGNPRVALRNLYADPLMAIVFLLEYTFHREDNRSLNQSILIGWAAWTPFSDGVYSGKAVETRVSFVGGPRPNPEGVLCYKNVLNQPDAIKPLAEKLEIFVDFKFYENGRSVHNTPTPRRAVESARTTSGRKPIRTTVNVSQEEEEHNRFPPLVDTARSITSVDEMKEINAELDRFIEKPMEQPIHVENRVQRPLEEEKPQTSVYKIPFEEMKTSNFPRSVHSLFARENYTQIKDRHGNSPLTEDVTLKGIVDMNRERLDRLDTSHVFFQFVAFKQLAATDSVPLKKVFFTINFFRFPELNTESLLLTTMEKNEPSVLTRLDRNGETDQSAAPGFVAKYMIEGDEERNDFLDFMATGHACIDVWNSDSFLNVGSTIVPMKSLYRKGKEAVQMFIQCPIIETALNSGSKANSLLYLRVVNVGLPSVNMYDPSSLSTTTGASTSSNVVRRLTSSIRLNEEGPHTYRVHAKPLPGSSGGGLDRFLTAQRLDIQQRHEQLFNENSLERIRHWNELKNGFEFKDNREVAQKFIFEEELAAYKKLRYESKPAKLLEAVFKGITTCHQIRPSFGEKVFFEFPLQNTISEPVNCTIEFDDEALRPVFDDEEWRFYKTINKISTPLERNMMRQTADRIELFLQPGETLFIPFIYDAFYFQSDTFNMYSTKVVFRRWDTNEPLAILDLHVHRRSFLVHHAVTFISETSGNWEKQLIMPPMVRDRRILSIRCSDPSVRLNLRNATLQQIVGFTTYSGEASDAKSFLLLMYSDHYQTRLLATWKVTILPFLNVDFRGIVGQTTRLELLVNRKSDHDVVDDLLNVFVSSESMKVVNSVLTTRAPIASIDFTPNFVGTKKFVVSVVNTNTKSLERGFIVLARSEGPRITQKFVIQISTNDAKRKIPIQNPYGIPKTFRITTSHPDIVKIDDGILVVPPLGKLPCEMYFMRVSHLQQTIETLLYISDAATNAQEEAYSLTISFDAV